MGFRDAFAVVGVLLVLSGIAILLTGKPKGGTAAGARGLGPNTKFYLKSMP
jgi:DHA2 family multidrug resistance protein